MKYQVRRLYMKCKQICTCSGELHFGPIENSQGIFSKYTIKYMFGIEGNMLFFLRKMFLK